MWESVIRTIKVRDSSLIEKPLFSSAKQVVGSHADKVSFTEEVSDVLFRRSQSLGRLGRNKSRNPYGWLSISNTFIGVMREMGKEGKGQ